MAVAESKWVMRATATVGADVDSVVEWWRDPKRTDDLRAYLGKSGAVDIVIETSEATDLRTRETCFRTPAGAEVRQRLETEVGPHGTVAPNGDGFLIRSRHEDRILYANGREVTCRCALTVEFAPIDPQGTRIVETHDQHRTGVPWWERFLPPNSARVQLNHRLRDWAELCRIDLGA